MADSTSVLAAELLTALQAAKEAAANALFDAGSPSTLYGRRAATCTGLVFGYYGGRFNSTSIANGTITCGSSTTTYVVADRSSGTVSSSTATTNWNDQTTYARLYKLVSGGSSITSYEDHRTTLAPPSTASIAREVQVACSDMTTAITAGTDKAYVRAPRAMTITGVSASLFTPQASGSIFTVDIHKNGTTILSTQITIDNTEATSLTAATPAVVSVTSVASDDLLTFDVDQVGDGTATGLIVTIHYT